MQLPIININNNNYNNIKRRKTKKISLHHNNKIIHVGGDAPITIQSMTISKTTDYNKVLQEIAELTTAGCDIVRVAVPSQDDANVLHKIVKKSPVPIIADIHFQSKYIFQAIDAGCACIRVNPGNIKKFDNKIPEIVKYAKSAKVPIRIGVNAGSLDDRFIIKHKGVNVDSIVASALNEIKLFEEHEFYDIKISVKHHDPMMVVASYKKLAELCNYPFHLGVTEAGTLLQGTIKSSVAMGILLNQGIGDTIRVSLSAPPIEEVKVGIKILESLNLRKKQFEIISCPSCGRAQVDVYKLANETEKRFQNFKYPLRIAVMGCIVNGPGEAREADLGVAAGNEKGKIFVKGKVIKTVPEHAIVDTLFEEANNIVLNNS